VSAIPQLTLWETRQLAAAFAAFHAANPDVYAELKDRALRLHAMGRSFGIATIYEALRYDRMLETDGDAFKLNNNWRAFYARLLLRDHPELRNTIHTREQTAA
jgi:hypothetical protein